MKPSISRSAAADDGSARAACAGFGGRVQIRMRAAAPRRRRSGRALASTAPPRVKIDVGEPYRGIR